MTNPKDELVTKGAVQKILDKINGYELVNGELKERQAPQGDYLYFEDISEAIDKLPAVLPNSRQAREIKSPEEIERAIEYLEELRDSHNIDLGGNLKAFQTHIDLLLLILNREQSTWDEEQIFGKS